METKNNRQIHLVKRPTGMPSENNFKIVNAEIPSTGKGKVLTRNLYVSVDPYMRGRMNDSGDGQSFGLNEVIRGRTIGRVMESQSEDLKEGDYVTGMMGWEEYSTVSADDVEKVNPQFAPLSSYLGILGLTGLTAYFGLLSVAAPEAGDTVVVSAAAGAVGSAVGQIAKLHGCRVIGIAGSEIKVKYLREELHFEEALNYKSSSNLEKDLREACPEGVDVYFDNVGGKISDAVLSLLNQNARISICGQIALYNLEETPVGPRVQPILLAHRAAMQGFTVRQFADEFPEARKQLGSWLEEGKIISTEHVVEGFENIPNAFIGLFKGENLGKQVVKL